jgi:hypothetical protein
MGKLEDNKERILSLFHDKHYSMNMIGKEFGVSRQAIQQMFKSWGVDTTDAAWVWVTCSYDKCANRYKIPRSVARRKEEKGDKNFCTKECYNKWFRQMLS